MKEKRKIKALICAAALVTCLAVVSARAYFVAVSKNMTNVFTFGNVEATMTETEWDADAAKDMRQGDSFSKNPSIENIGSADAFVFCEVDIPKRDVFTYNPSDGSLNEKAVTRLFQLNASGAPTAYTGTDTVNDGWKYVRTHTDSEDYDRLVYAYAAGSSCKVLKPGEKTSDVFSSVTYGYPVEGQGLDDEILNIRTKFYAIQTKDLTADDAKDPATVWEIINNQAS